MKAVLRAMLAGSLVFLGCAVSPCPEGDCPGDSGNPVDRGDGWDDPVGRGMVYAISTIQIAPANVGFDLDGRCLGASCIDNRCSAAAPILNDAINQAHFNGDGRTIIEIAGNDAPAGDDPRATFKTYEAIDWTEPRLPADDFTMDFANCCKFFVTARSTIGDPARAKWRAPALIDDGRIQSAGVGSLAFTLPLIREPRVMPLEMPRFEAMRVSEIDPRLTLVLGGAVPAFDLALVANPERIDPERDETVLDFLVSRGVQPDLDLDGDGLETFAFDPETARVGACYDGCNEECPQQLPIAPEDVDRPWTCAFADSVRDAYSITLVLAATPAFILGVR
jgi:hypothetical protein